VCTSTDTRVAAASPLQAVAPPSLILLAVDYVLDHVHVIFLDNIYDRVHDYVIVRMAHMVFVKLIERSVVFFEHRRATHGSSGPTIDRSPHLSDSFCLAQPHRQRCRLFPDYFVYSGKQATSTSFAPSFFCACDRRGGLIC
jgi:hypothetical protein